MPSDPTPGSPGSSTNPSGNHAARFIAQFARRPTLMRRGVLPGTRVWATTAGAAALVVVGVLVVPLLARMDLFSGSASTSVRSAAAGGSDTAVSTDGRLAPSPQASRGTGSGSPRSGAAAAGGSGSGIAGLPAVGGGAAGQQSGPDTAGLAASGGGTSGQQSGSGTKNQSGGAAQSGSSSSTTTTSSSGSSTSGTTSAPGVRLLGSESHRCIDVTDDSAKDGTSLQVWTCNTQANQKWLFASDGTVRSMGLCMDVAGGSTRNGAVIQLANCHHDGNGAQQFVLSSAGDLVNRQADKCVDVVNQGTSAGTGLQLWTCNGQPNQKWHKA
ncbi:ricin-type beta-trefoil lectin domain protein [Streptomyces sp. NPDC004129]|uniref:RICIN domain-containing protein n=1 Tax=Streptomyces sp. NPDC004533 TaxID=3154278 RepID=UPI0033B2711C